MYAKCLHTCLCAHVFMCCDFVSFNTATLVRVLGSITSQGTLHIYLTYQYDYEYEYYYYLLEWLLLLLLFL